MRRIRIWSALIAVLVLALIGGGYWAYWNFYSKFQPVTVSTNQSEIQRLLDEASWVSEGGGGPAMYIVGYRENPATRRYEREEGPKLRAAGVDARFIVFARADREGLARSTAVERATVAELWLTRDWSLYRRWIATPVNAWDAPGIAPADGDLARSAVVDGSRAFVDKLADLLDPADVGEGYPLIIWRDREGFMKACACSDPRSWAFIRDDLNAPDAIGPDMVPTPADIAPPVAAAPAPAGTAALPYPTLPPIGQGEALPPAAPAAGAAPVTPPATTAPAPGARAQPQPKRQDDATFF